MKTIFLATLLMSNFAIAAGGVDGGGGKGIVCRDSHGQIKSAELLDLYEGRVVFGLNAATSSAPMQEQIDSALARIPANSRGLIEVYVATVLDNMKIMPPGTKLLPIDDSFEAVVEKGCNDEQLANYYNDRKILIDGEIWAKLSETDRAALVMHEAIYAVNRLVGAKNSRQSRHANAAVFSDSVTLTDIRDGVPANALICAAPGKGLMFRAYPSASGEWTAQFEVLGSNYVSSKKTATFSGPEIDLNEAKDFPVLKGDDQVGAHWTAFGFTKSDFEGDDMVSLTRRLEAIIDSTTGKVIKGYSTPRYYLSFTSGTHPNTEANDLLVNCSITMP